MGVGLRVYGLIKVSFAFKRFDLVVERILQQ